MQHVFELHGRAHPRRETRRERVATSNNLADLRRQRDDTSVQLSATDVVSNLGPPGERSEDAPFVGNLTTAVGDKPNELEHPGPPGGRSEDAPLRAT